MADMDDSIFDVDGGSSDFDPEPKPLKAKAAPKKTAVATKPKAPPKPKQTTLDKPKKTAAPKKRAKPESDIENSDVDIDSFNDDSLLSNNNTPPSAKRQKKAPAPKKSGGKPLSEIDNESFGGLDGAVGVAPAGKKAGGSAAEKYQKLTQLEHILKRPDTYIGAVERTEQPMWVYNSETELMETRNVSYVPGLYKIFDEILVNAADNRQRDKNMDEIRVEIDVEEGVISVRNNGKGIPIEIHEKEGIYVPELIFGHLLAGSNFDDDKEKVVGGRNGFGAKLCNVFSTEFTIETGDGKNKQKYVQKWTDNMSRMGKHKITSHKGEDYTKVTFKPDLAKFGMDKMDDDFVGLVKRRVFDMAGTCKEVKVYLNKERLKVRNFKKYMELYTKALKAENLAGEGKADEQVIITDNPHERWEIGFAVSDGSFQQVSFVNSIATSSGGSHVNYVADQIVTKLIEVVKKKKKGGVQLKPAQIRNHLFLFVNCLIVNPAFNSQTKEQLTTKPSQFGSKFTVSDKFLKQIAATDVVNNIIAFADKKADAILKKSDGNKRTRMHNAKLVDANKAGTKDGHLCTLILTEGDSAAGLAIAGRSVIDPDRIGVFPLRGKLLNVREASIDQISKNQEIQNIKQFIGLQHKKHYANTMGLRYGHIMIMTDQDHDGSHIKGLLINFFECSFPSLLKIPGFLQVFITPIVKVWKGNPDNPKKLQSFFTMPEYEAWKQVPGNDRGWDHKYFKGLGTSSTADGEAYFREIDRHLKEFATMKDHEPDLISLAFSKKKADARKEWLRDFIPGTYLDMRPSEISYEDFINKELILFSMADNIRSIPSVVDGFKPGQRKVLYTCFRRNLKKDIKVVELAGSVSGLTAYSYGETSLQQTIVGLAQNFVGSNNVNVLHPSGNFGSRLQGGSDAASARYIYTRLSPFARKVFHASDEPLLTYNLDDGKTIEPEVYVPVVPMILINGADGIGTGWSSSIPNYNPEEVVENLKLRMKGTKDDMKFMKPWFRGWTGEVEDIGNDRFKFSGTITRAGNTIEVTELPVRYWTQDFKDKLEDILKAEKTASIIKDYAEYNTPTRVHFIIKMDEKHAKFDIASSLEDVFKLSKTMATTNLVAFDAQGRIHKYATPLDMLEEFFQVRIKYYQKRKEYLMNEMTRDLDKLNNQARFIQMIIDGKLVINRKKKTALVAELRQKEFKPFPKMVDARKAGEFEPAAEDDAGVAEEKDDEPGAHDFDYLLGMQLWSLTQERIDRLRKQIGDKEVELDALIATSPAQLWETDLDDFLFEWHHQLSEEAKRARDSKQAGRRASAKLRIAGKPAKKRKIDDDDSDGDFAVGQSKKVAGAKSKPSDMFSWLDKAPKPRVNPLTQVPASRPPAEEQGLITKISDESRHASDQESIAAAFKVKASNASQAAKPAKPVKEDSDDDVFLAAAEEMKPSKRTAVAGGRTQRAAAAKPAYKLEDSSDESDNGEDFLNGIGDMVKTVPNKSGTIPAAAKPMFANSGARPSSSGSGMTSSTKPRMSTFRDDGDSADDKTDYKNLVPRGSPEKPALKKAREFVVSDDDDDDLDLPIAKPSLKSSTSKIAAPSIPMSKTATKRVEKKPKPSAAASTTTSSKLTSVEKKQSPAAKAYAKKLAKGDLTTVTKPQLTQSKLTSAKLKKPARVESDDEDAAMPDVDDLANELLDEDEDEPVPAKKATSNPVAARPSRRAAVTKSKKYVVDDDSTMMSSESEEATADDFDDDDSE